MVLSTGFGEIVASKAVFSITSGVSSVAIILLVEAPEPLQLAVDGEFPVTSSQSIMANSELTVVSNRIVFIPLASEIVADEVVFQVFQFVVFGNDKLEIALVPFTKTFATVAEELPPLEYLNLMV